MTYFADHSPYAYGHRPHPGVNLTLSTSAAAASSAAEHAKAPTMIGPFRLIRVLGAGGMGQVWLAEQTEPMRRTVALKLIKVGMYDDEVLQRFRESLDFEAKIRILDLVNECRTAPAGWVDCTSAPVEGWGRGSAASDSSFSGDEVVAFGRRVRLDSGQLRACRGRLPRLHFDFSKRKTRIEFDAHITKLSRLRNDGGQFIACPNPGCGLGFFSRNLDARRGNGGLPADFRILALGCERACVLDCLLRVGGFTLCE